jgi:hypothetical protein
MFDDQQDRAIDRDKIDWKVVSARDAERRKEVLGTLRDGGLRTAKDYHDAALVFQHGETANEIELANALAVIASKMHPDDADFKWLVAATWDRLLMRYGKPQWYGTQYVRDEATARWKLYAIDEDAVTDARRRELNVPTIGDARARADDLNR